MLPVNKYFFIGTQNRYYRVKFKKSNKLHGLISPKCLYKISENNLE